MPVKIERNNVYLATSTFGAHMNNLSRGFNVDSVVFLLDIFLNWVSPSAHDANPIKEEAFITIYLEDLVNNGFAKKLTRKAPFRYTLNEAGLIELSKRAVDNTFLYSRVEFFFVYSYLENYSARTFSMMKYKGSYFPYQARLEIESLLDQSYFVDKQFEVCLREISSLKERIELASEISKFVDPLVKENLDPNEIINSVEENFPYALHSMLEVSNLLKEFTAKQVVWELSNGSINRSNFLWKFELEKLELHVEQLNKLRKQVVKSK